MNQAEVSPSFAWDAPEIIALVRAALEEDIGPCDLTGQSVVPPSRKVRARIVAKQDLILAGLPLAERVFRERDSKVQVEAVFPEGASVRAGKDVAHLEGNARAILSAERTAINFLAHLCGIATVTRQFADVVAGTRARIRDTRKTTPLLRALEKYAVRIGGGANHRFGLFDAILIKENHIAIAGSVAEALRRAKEFASAMREAPREMTAYESYQPRKTGEARVAVQIEVRSEKELREALKAGAQAVLLDNVSPGDAARLVGIIRRDKPECVVEVSGGVSLVTVRAYAQAGVDFISVGAITHSAQAADLSLLVEAASSE